MASEAARPRRRERVGDGQRAAERPREDAHALRCVERGVREKRTAARWARCTASPPVDPSGARTAAQRACCSASA